MMSVTSSSRTKGQRKKAVPPSAEMQTANGKMSNPSPADPQNGHHDAALVKDLVYQELFAEVAPSPVRHTNGNSKRNKPGPLSKKTLKLEKAREAEKTSESEPTNGHQSNDQQSNDHPTVNSCQIDEQTTGGEVSDSQVKAVEFLPAELFQPEPQEAFPEYIPAEPSFQDDSFASTELFADDQSTASIEVCVSPTAIQLDTSHEPVATTTPFPDPPAKIIAEDELPASTPIVAASTPIVAASTPIVAASPREFKETPRGDYRSFLSISARPSLRSVTPSTATTSTPTHYFSFLRGGRNADDPPTPYPEMFAVKRKAESPGTDADAKRVKPVEAGFFSRVTAPLFRRFAARELPTDEDEGIDEGVAEGEEAEVALATAEPAGRSCVLM